MFIDKLLYHRQNVKLFLDTNGIRVLVDLVTLAHLHTQRAYVRLQTTALEASPDQQRDTEKEWHYSNKDKEKEGPYSFGEMKELWKESSIHQKTRCWAQVCGELGVGHGGRRVAHSSELLVPTNIVAMCMQGMEGWRPVEQIPQLKWHLMARGTSLINESEMAVLILQILIRMCEFYPSRYVKNRVSSSATIRELIPPYCPPPPSLLLPSGTVREPLCGRCLEQRDFSQSQPHSHTLSNYCSPLTPDWWRELSIFSTL